MYEVYRLISIYLSAKAIYRTGLVIDNCFINKDMGSDENIV